ncbi:hypothetical protein B1691_14585, partial [Geobacillus sp. 47C-IIb]
FLVWPKHRSFPPFLPRLTFIIKQLVDFVDKLRGGYTASFFGTTLMLVSFFLSPLLSSSVIAARSSLLSTMLENWDDFHDRFDPVSSLLSL